MTLEERELYIDDCVMMTADLNGVEYHEVDQLQFEMLDDENLVSEHQWLYEMVYLK